MKSGFIVTTGGPRDAASLAAEAEAAGWDGVFTWDGISIGVTDTYDPWVVMSAMAMRTERVRLGAIVTPPARRRPWKLARETVTLDHLSNGRWADAGSRSRATNSTIARTSAGSSVWVTTPS
jgi:alkanesulfonate monooxygenase SsuD/methylene tetrahydromethanopterin reductase-like flavin-dependent oxidoreductase (luciferase family)